MTCSYGKLTVPAVFPPPPSFLLCIGFLRFLGVRAIRHLRTASGVDSGRRFSMKISENQLSFEAWEDDRRLSGLSFVCIWVARHPHASE